MDPSAETGAKDLHGQLNLKAMWVLLGRFILVYASNTPRGSGADFDGR